MVRRTLQVLGLALAALAVVLVAIHQDMLTARAATGPTIESGWDGPLSYQERQLAALATGALPVAALSGRFSRAGYLVQAAGAALLYLPLRAMLHWATQPEVYTGLPMANGTSGEFVFATEGPLLVVGGVLLIAAGVAAVRLPAPDDSGLGLGREEFADR